MINLKKFLNLRALLMLFTILPLILSMMGCGGGGNITPPPTINATKFLESNYIYTFYSDPMYSTDGSKLLYVEEHGYAHARASGEMPSKPAHFLIIYDFNTSAKILLTGTEYFSDAPTWFPDVDKIAFLSTMGGNSEEQYSGDLFLWEINPDGSAAHKLTDEIKLSTLPTGNISINPDGNHILYISEESKIISFDTSDLSNKEVLSKECYFAAWSHTGTKIAALCKETQGNTLILVNPDGTDYQILSIASGKPAWSPDDNLIVYPLNNDLYIYNIQNDSKYSLNLGFQNESLKDPDWSPDGKRIVFSSISTLWIHNFK